MLAKHKIIGFLPITDAKASRAFYETKLGLTYVSDDPFALVFAAGDTTIRLQKVPKVTPQRSTALGWEVADVTAAVKELGARGIAFERFQGLEQDQLGVWSAPSGAKVAWFQDPDGHTLSLSQH